MIKILFYLIIISINSHFSNNYIVLPFNHEKSNLLNNEMSLKDEINDFLEADKPYTLISLSDQITAEFYISLRFFYFFLGKGLCRKDTLSNYSLEKSNTFKNISYCTDDLGYINDVCYSRDKISFFNNIKLNENITLNNLSFLFGQNRYKREIYDIHRICGYIGFQIEYNNLDYKEYNFIKILKKERIISSYTWSILYFNDHLNSIIPEEIKSNNKGFFMLGIEDKDYKQIFLTEDIRTIKAKPRYGTLDWGILFNEIYFENKINNEKSSYQSNIQIIFDLESNFILGTKYFFENIEKTLFKKYIEQNICFINEEVRDDGKYIIICNKNFSKYISSFPDLYFFHKELNYTFVLKNEELFMTKGNHIYFLIIHKIYYVDYWSLGTIFLKKYPFLFDYDKKTIGFINIYNNKSISNLKEKTKEENSSKLKTFWSFVKNMSIIFGIIIGILIGKKIWDRNRKKRANELIDDYQYEAYEKNKNENKDFHLKENQLYEMN